MVRCQKVQLFWYVIKKSDNFYTLSKKEQPAKILIDQILELDILDSHCDLFFSAGLNTFMRRS